MIIVLLASLLIYPEPNLTPADCSILPVAKSGIEVVTSSFSSITGAATEINGINANKRQDFLNIIAPRDCY